MGMLIHSLDEIKEYFVQIGRSAEKDEAEAIENLMFLLISTFSLIIEENDGLIDTVEPEAKKGNLSTLVKQLTSGEPESENTQYNILLCFSYDFHFSSSIKCRKAKKQIEYVVKNIEADRIYTMELGSVYQFRTILRESYREAGRPKAFLAADEKLGINENTLTVFMELSKTYCFQ